MHPVPPDLIQDKKGSIQGYARSASY